MSFMLHITNRWVLYQDYAGFHHSMRLNFFSVRTINHWNRFPGSEILTPFMDSFQTRLDLNFFPNPPYLSPPLWSFYSSFSFCIHSNPRLVGYTTLFNFDQIEYGMLNGLIILKKRRFSLFIRHKLLTTSFLTGFFCYVMPMASCDTRRNSAHACIFTTVSWLLICKGSVRSQENLSICLVWSTLAESNSETQSQIVKWACCITWIMHSTGS